MFTDINDRDLDDLFIQLRRAAGNLKEGHDDLQRIAALKVARRLVHALEKPEEKALLMGLSVRVSWKSCILKINLTP